MDCYATYLLNIYSKHLCLSYLYVWLILWFVFAMHRLCTSLHCGLLAGEFNALFSFEIKPHCLVHFVLCLCCALVCISLECGLIAGEFIVFLTFKSKPSCLVHLCFVFAMLFVLFNVLWIKRRWVQCIVYVLSPTPRFCSFFGLSLSHSFCLFQCTVNY